MVTHSKTLQCNSQGSSIGDMTEVVSLTTPNPSLEKEGDRMSRGANRGEKSVYLISFGFFLKKGFAVSRG